MFRRVCLTLLRAVRPYANMASNTPMEDAIRTKVGNRKKPPQVPKSSRIHHMRLGLRTTITLLKTHNPPLPLFFSFLLFRCTD